MQVWNRGAARGSKHEPVNCPMSDTGLFRALKAMGITALHSGHDHDNNYEGLLDGVRLAYGHKTGAQYLQHCGDGCLCWQCRCQERHSPVQLLNAALKIRGCHMAEKVKNH